LLKTRKLELAMADGASLIKRMAVKPIETTIPYFIHAGHNPARNGGNVKKVKKRNTETEDTEE